MIKFTEKECQLWQIDCYGEWQHAASLAENGEIAFSKEFFSSKEEAKKAILEAIESL